MTFSLGLRPPELSGGGRDTSSRSGLFGDQTGIARESCRPHGQCGRRVCVCVCVCVYWVEMVSMAVPPEPLLAFEGMEVVVK